MTEVLEIEKPKSATVPGARFAFVKANWHAPIVEQSLAGFKAEMVRLGYPESAIDAFDVPGAFEIPLHAQTLANSGRYDAVVGAALIVDGGIYRHDFVAETVVGALMQVQLKTETPMISLMLTPHHFHEHDIHQKFFQDHFVQKGAEAARACAQTVASLASLAPAR